MNSDTNLLIKNQTILFYSKHAIIYNEHQQLIINETYWDFQIIGWKNVYKVDYVYINLLLPVQHHKS